MGEVVVEFGYRLNVVRVVGVVVVGLGWGVFFGGSACHGGGLEVGVV